MREKGKKRTKFKSNQDKSRQIDTITVTGCLKAWASRPWIGLEYKIQPIGCWSQQSKQNHNGKYLKQFKLIT